MNKYMNNILKNTNLFLFFSFIFSSAVLILVGAHTYNILEDVLRNSKHSQKIRDHVENIRFFDEVLTNSTLLAASTGNAQWEKRHHSFEPKLNSAIYELVQIDSLHTLKMIESANVQLTAIEHRVFELIHLKKQNEAYALITGSEYIKQKEIYSEGISSFIKLHEVETNQQQTQLYNAAKRNKWFFIIIILVFTIIWFSIVYLLHKNRVQILKQNEELELHIQARKESENALQESQKQIEKAHEQLQESIKASGVGFWDRNLQTNEVYHSPEWKKQIGYGDDELQGGAEVFMPHLHPDDAERVKEITKEFLSGKRDNFEAEYRFRHKNGSYRWILGRASIQNDKNGKPLRLLGTHLDITERKKAEEELHASQQLIEGIINAIPVRIFWKDKNLVYLGCNKIFALDAGFSDPKDIIGKDDFQMGWRDQAELYRSGDLQVMESGYPILLNEEPQTTPEGNTIILLTNKLPLRNSMGEIIGILGTSMDITDRKQAQVEIKKTNEELVKLNAEKDKFFSIIAHDLKSPFNSIMGFSEIVVEQVKKKNYQGIEKYTGIILQSSKRAMDLLINLMEWSRSQTGRMEFNPEYFEMVELINEVTLLLSDASEKKSIKITKNSLPHAPVYADKNMISTVLRNLISNAIKFTYLGGGIIISTEEKQGELLVSVKDNGVGISKERIEKLFLIDENYSTPGTQSEQGTGLGVILCKEFVEKHGGKIWVKSEEGKGSIFYFTIPT